MRFFSDQQCCYDVDEIKKNETRQRQKMFCFVYLWIVLVHLRATSQTNSCCPAVDNKGFSDSDIFIGTPSNCVGIFYSGQLSPLNVSHWAFKY